MNLFSSPGIVLAMVRMIENSYISSLIDILDQISHNSFLVLFFLKLKTNNSGLFINIVLFIPGMYCSKFLLSICKFT